MQPAISALNAVGRALLASRGQIQAQWADWVVSRRSAGEHLQREVVERQLGLLLKLLIELTGPLKREVKELWLSAAEWYGRTAAQRGLAAGEIVEEFQYLRELLSRHLSEFIVALPARHSMAVIVRINQLLDTGIAHAVVGYTDAIVESLLERQGLPIGTHEEAETQIVERLEQFEGDITLLKQRSERKDEVEISP